MSFTELLISNAFKNVINTTSTSTTYQSLTLAEALKTELNDSAENFAANIDNFIDESNNENLANLVFDLADLVTALVNGDLISAVQKYLTPENEKAFAEAKQKFISGTK